MSRRAGSAKERRNGCWWHDGKLVTALAVLLALVGPLVTGLLWGCVCHWRRVCVPSDHNPNAAMQSPGCITLGERILGSEACPQPRQLRFEWKEG